MKVLIAGGAGFRNAGDEALLRASVQIAKASNQCSQITVAANNFDVANDTLRGLGVALVPSPRNAIFRNDGHYGSADEEFRRRWRIARASFASKDSSAALAAARSSGDLDFIDRPQTQQFLSAIANADALIIHGGGILTSATRSRLWEQALTVEIAARWGKRILLRSQQIGPFSNSLDKERIQTILRSADFISTRDKDQSSVAAKKLYPNVRVVDQVDDALFVSVGDENDEAVLERYGLKQRGYICVGYRNNPHVGVTEDAFERTAAILKIANCRYQCPMVLLPQGPFDIPALKILASKLDFDVTIVEPQDGFRDPIAIAQNARLMIACPHHSLIFALRGSTPILSPVMGDYYLFKNIGSMRFFGLDEYVLDIADPHETVMGRATTLIDRIVANETTIRESISSRLHQLRVSATEFDKLAFSHATEAKTPSGHPQISIMKRTISKIIGFRPFQ